MCLYMLSSESLCYVQALLRHTSAGNFIIIHYLKNTYYKTSALKFASYTVNLH